jgi:hypothetical protein
MNCFLIKMVFQVICGNGNHTPQFDEQLRLIFATDALAAVQKAKQMAAEETTDTPLVEWKFIAVTDVYPFKLDLDGAALFSTIKETELNTAYIHTLQLKEQDMLAACNTIYC